MRKKSRRKQKFKFRLSRQALMAVVTGILLALAPFVIMRSGYNGDILIAGEHVGYPFDKSLILIDQHGLEGAVGVILNKPLPENQQARLSAFIRNAGIPVGYGGPLGLYERIVILEEKKPIGNDKAPRFDLSDWDDAVRATPDLLDRIRQSIKNGDQHYRVFTGVTSWSSFQLESEVLIRNEWRVLPASHDAVFQNGVSSQWDALEEQAKAKNKPKSD